MHLIVCITQPFHNALGLDRLILSESYYVVLLDVDVRSCNIGQLQRGPARFLSYEPDELRTAL